MSCGVHWETPRNSAGRKARSRALRPRATTPKRTSLGRLFASSLLALALCASGCAPKSRPYSSKEAVDALQKISSQIKTERGRAWLTVRSRVEGADEAKISFPAVVVIDRTNAAASQLRIEAMDPLGATHALMILEKGRTLTWVDYDQRRVYTMRDTWNGLPLSKLPELVLGLGALPEDGRVGSADADGFEVRAGSHVFKYLMSWIDPGPRLALGGIDGAIGKGSDASRYAVRYSHYLDTADYYLPQDAELKGFTGKAAEPQVEVHVAWRERRWNEEIPAQLFQLPKKVLREFQRQ